MINYNNTKSIPNNLNSFHLSPSSVSKYLPNTMGLSKTKQNVVYETCKPNTLFIGNTIHYGIEMVSENNYDLIDTIKEVIKIRGYANGELSRSAKYLSIKKDVSQLKHYKLNKELCLSGAKWLLDNCLDFNNQRYEMEIYGAVINNFIYSGTADVIHRNKDKSYSLYDFKNYNGTSDYERQTHFNQLMIYATMASQKGINIKEIKIFNPIEQTIESKPITDEYLQSFIDNQLTK